MTGQPAQRVSDRARDPSEMGEGTRARPGLLPGQAVREGPCAWSMTTKRSTSHGAGKSGEGPGGQGAAGSNGSAPMLAVARTS